MSILKVKKRIPKNANEYPLNYTLKQAKNADTIKLPRGKWQLDDLALLRGQGGQLIIEGYSPQTTTIVVSGEQFGFVMQNQFKLTLKNVHIIVPNQTYGIYVAGDKRVTLNTENVIMTYQDDNYPLQEAFPLFRSDNPHLIWNAKNTHIVGYISAKAHTMIAWASTFGSIMYPCSQIFQTTVSEYTYCGLHNIVLQTIGKDPVKMRHIVTNGHINILSGFTLDGLYAQEYGTITTLNAHEADEVQSEFTLPMEAREATEEGPLLFKRPINVKQRLVDRGVSEPSFIFGCNAYGKDGDPQPSGLITGPFEIAEPNPELEHLAIKKSNFRMYNTALTLKDIQPLKNNEPSLITLGELNLINVEDLSSWTLNNVAINLTNSTSTALESNKPKEISALDEIDEMIGLESAKATIHQMVTQARMNAERQARGIGGKSDASLHMLFLGSAGTGKTTVARLVAKALYQNKVVPTNKFVDATAKDLVAEHVGQTAPKTHAKFMEAKGGVLFIDEAYSLKSTQGSNSFNGEAVSQLIADMEDNRHDTVVILAGYTNEILDFINNDNPGLKSRFTNKVYFEDYNEEELTEIFNYQVKHQGALAADYPTLYHGHDQLIDLHRRHQAQGGVNNGNGRFVRNFIQAIIMQRDQRLGQVADISSLSDEDFAIFTIQDIDLGHDAYAQNNQI